VIRQVARRILPPRMRSQIRDLRIEWLKRTYRARECSHVYAGIPLRLRLVDAVAESWYDHDWPELAEFPLAHRSRLRPGGRVFDHGAHQAMVAMILGSAVGPSGQVIAVEGSPHNARAAADNVRLNRMEWVRVVNAAVADRPGTVRFGRGFNSSVDESPGELGHDRVPATTVDALAAEFGMPDLVFLDVEGYEAKALRGAANVLRSAADWMIEVHAGFGLEAAGGSVAEVLQHFTAARYRRLVRSYSGDYQPFNGSDAPPDGAFHILALDRRGDFAAEGGGERS
jgi:FkbM family methyltransferase